MVYENKVYVLVRYPDQGSPVVAYSRGLEGEQDSAWQDAASVVKAKLLVDRIADPLVTVYAPSGVVPKDMLAFRWAGSPPGVDVLHLGNLSLA